MKNNNSLRNIAKNINRSVSSISVEVRLGGGFKKYDPVLADKRSKKKAKSRRFGKRKIDKNKKLKKYIFHKIIDKQWSPEQITKWWKKYYHRDMNISHETIYAYIYVLPKGSLKKELLAGLRQERKYRRKQKRGVKTKRDLENMLSIHERPKEVEDRIISEHWEGDLIIGKRNQSCLGTLMERTTRTLLLVPLKNKMLNM